MVYESECFFWSDILHILAPFFPFSICSQAGNHLDGAFELIGENLWLKSMHQDHQGKLRLHYEPSP